MFASNVDLSAIKAQLAVLKAAYPRKRGLRLFLGASIATGADRVHLGFAQWDGSLRGLLRAREGLLGDYWTMPYPRLTLHVTHPAIASNEPAAIAAKADITALALKDCGAAHA